jgi:hypothetical protein
VLRPRFVRSLAVCALTGAGIFAGGNAAAADIHELAERVRGEWSQTGTRVDALPARFLFDDETVKLLLPATQGAECVTIGIIGARGMSFHVKVAGVVDDPLEDTRDARAASVAGVLELVRCKKPTERIILTNDAGRGAVEILVATGKIPPPALSSVLLERTGGTSLVPPDMGQSPPMPAAEERARRADIRGAADSGRVAAHVIGEAESDGNGRIELELEPACHALDVFADASARVRRLDLDAELRDEDDVVLARDRTEAADAHLFACVGEPTPAAVTFVGAPPRASIVLAHSSWPIADSLPTAWGPTPRARMAAALRSRHLPPPTSRPVYLAQGVAGETSLTAPVLPASCYVATVAVTNGHARGIGLRANVGRTEANDDRAPGDEGGAVAFCTTTERSVRLGVDARPVGVTWGLALFRVLTRKATP